MRCNKRGFKVIAVKGNQNKIDCYTFHLKIWQLKQIYKIDLYTGEKIGLKEEGIQRERKENEVKNFISYLHDEHSFCPTSLWLNDRDKSSLISNLFKKHSEIVKIVFDRDSISSIYVPDGHLRTLSFIRALEEDIDGKLDDFDINVIMTQVDKSLERRGFIDINLNAKRIKSGHVSAQYHEIAIIDGVEGLNNREEISRAIAFGITHKLNSSKSSPLYNLIKNNSNRKPYSSKSIKKDHSKLKQRIMPEDSFLNYLSKDFINNIIYDSYYFPSSTSISLKIEILFSYFNDFWKALKKVSNEKLWEDPRQYAFFNQLGIRAFIHVFSYFMSEMKKTKTKPNVNNFEKRLEKIKTLKNVKYWRSKQSWHLHPDCPSQKEDKIKHKTGFINHPDFKGAHLIGVSGSNQGIIVGEKLIEEWKVSRFKKSSLNKTKKVAK